MAYVDLKNKLDEYNWDDGFEVQEQSSLTRIAIWHWRWRFSIWPAGMNI